MQASYTGNDPGDGCIGDRRKQPALRTRDDGQHGMIEELLNMHMMTTLLAAHHEWQRSQMCAGGPLCRTVGCPTVIPERQLIITSPWRAAPCEGCTYSVTDEQKVEDVMYRDIIAPFVCGLLLGAGLLTFGILCVRSGLLADWIIASLNSPQHTCWHDKGRPG
jgi:hypothetical protein